MFVLKSFVTKYPKSKGVKNLDRNFYKLLSKLNDNSIKKDELDKKEILDKLDSLRFDIDNTLIPFIEKIGYYKKYEIIDKIKAIVSQISLYINFPEIIGKTVIGVVSPDDKALPVIHHKSKSGDYCFYNIHENTAVFTKNEYDELMSNAKKYEINIRGLAYFLSAPDDSMTDDSVLINIPSIKKNDKNTVRTALFRLVDVLVISTDGYDCINLFDHPVAIVSFDNIDNKNDKSLRDYCNLHNIEYHNQELNTSAINFANTLINVRCKSKISFYIRMKSLLSELLWYLAGEKNALMDKFKMLNDNLLFKDSIVEEDLKTIRNEYSEKMDNEIEKYANELKTITSNMLEKLDNIEKILGTSDKNNDKGEDIAELIAKLSFIYKSFPEDDSAEIIRSLGNKLKDKEGYSEVADVLMKYFFNEKLSKIQVQELLNINTCSVFLDHIKIDLTREYSDMEKNCTEIILKNEQYVRSKDLFLIGKYYIDKDKLLSKKYLFAALYAGEKKAGVLLWKKSKEYFELTNDEKKILADCGIGEAAFYFGEQLYKALEKNGFPQDGNDYYECIKYLNIAGAAKIIDALKLAGNIYYYEYSEGEANAEKIPVILKYYEVAKKCGSVDKTMHERMGELYMKNENYQTARECFEFSQTAGSCFFLGEIYKNGNGVSVDDKTALSWYEKAINAGHVQAQVEYDRLNAKIEAAKKVTTTSSNTSYYSTSYYSSSYYSYYSSYSGW